VNPSNGSRKQQPYLQTNEVLRKDVLRWEIVLVWWYIRLQAGFVFFFSICV
jgi:hypothetical protein